MTLAKKEDLLWITGAGSGIGRAVAASAHPGTRVALSGRRVTELERTAELVDAAGGEAMVVATDVADAGAVRRAYESITGAWGPIGGVVAAAGLNSPQRFWVNQSMADFDSIVSTNLRGTAYVIDAVLPAMRRAQRGSIVVISSYAGWHLSSSPGVAYSASKRALGALTATVNAEAGADGVRATLICPGDVDTDFLERRPEAPSADSRERMLRASDVATAVQFALNSPQHVVIDELVISPTTQNR